MIGVKINSRKTNLLRVTRFFFLFSTLTIYSKLYYIFTVFFYNFYLIPGLLIDVKWYHYVL